MEMPSVRRNRDESPGARDVEARDCSRQTFKPRLFSPGEEKTEKKKRFVASVKGVDDPVQHNVQDCVVRRYGMTLLWPVTR